jgi:ribulose-phosphate 3-epimerase
VCAERGIDPIIQIDGGINPETAAMMARVGASCFVAGNAVFGAEDPIAMVHQLRREIDKVRSEEL